MTAVESCAVVLSPERTWAVGLVLQESDCGDRGAEGRCAFMLLPLCKQPSSDGEQRGPTPRLRFCGSCAVLVPDLFVSADNGCGLFWSPHSSWNKCPMPNNSAALAVLL